MRTSEYNELFDGLIEKIRVVREKKSNDYANDTNTLKNFYVQAELQSGLFGEKIPPQKIAMQFILTKLGRLVNLEGKDPKNESIEDTIIDALNYIGLYYALLLDQTPVEEEIKVEDLPF